MGGRTTAPAIVGVAEEWNASTPVGAWSTGTSINTARNDVVGAGANAEAALSFGGQAPGGVTGATESWNGSAWTEVNDLNNVRNGFAGNGIQTSALAYGSDNPSRTAKTESWNGSSWTEVADLNVAKRAQGGLGADNTSGLCFGGESGPTDNLAETELWNGSSWTEVNDLNTARLDAAGIGITTAGLAVAGRKVDPDSDRSETESWNGTNWTEVGDVNTARYGAFGSRFDYSDAFISGGRVPGTDARSADTELWNGASWTEVANMNVARMEGASSGTQSGAIISGGSNETPVITAVAEEWAGSSNTVKVLTD